MRVVILRQVRQQLRDVITCIERRQIAAQLRNEVGRPRTGRVDPVEPHGVEATFHLHPVLHADDEIASDVEHDVIQPSLSAGVTKATGV